MSIERSWRALATALIVPAGLMSAEPARAQIGDSVGIADIPAVSPTPRRLAGLDVPIHPRVAPSPNGRQVAAIQVRPRPVLWIVPTDGGEPFPFREMWAAYHARWSPAGQRVGFIAASGLPQIWTVEVDTLTGHPQSPARLLIRTAANAFAFAPDGETIALVTSRSTAVGASEIHLVDWTTRRYRSLLRDRGVIYRLDWAPDGDFIYYGLLPEDIEAEGAHRVVRARVRDGARTTVRVTGEFLGLSPDGNRLLYRPRGEPDTEGEVVETVSLGEDLPLRLRLPPDAGQPYWSADSNGLLMVRARAEGDEVWEVPLPAPASAPTR